MTILTTPGIDVLQIRRSKGVKRYVHLVHAATDIHGYKLYSFDYYDAVFCSGPHQVASLRTLEEKRRTEPKDLRIVGCAYFDRMVAQKKECAVAPDPKTVLIAPTWGRAGLLTKTGAAIPKRLAEAGYHVILRPHPQSFVSELPLMESLQKELAGYDNIEWDRNPNGFASLSRAGVMVSDFSGVVFDFAFVFERPVVSIGDGWQKDGYEAWDLPNPAWEMGVLDEIGIHLAAGEEAKAAEAVEALLQEGDARIERIRRVREAGIKNFGAAGEPIAQALLSLLAEVNAPESQAARPAARVSGKEE